MHLKSRDIVLPAKVHLVKALVFPVVTYECESWTIKKAEHRRINASELWCWRRLLRVPWTDKLDLLAVQGTLKNILQHHNLKASILQYSAFFMVQPSHLHMTTGKTIALTVQTFVSKVTLLLSNILSRCHSFSSKERTSFNFMAAVTICSDLE